MKQIALRIPADKRREILEKDIIARAVGLTTDQNMFHLMVIWRTYVEPGLGTCPQCVTRVLRNFRELQATLIDLEQDSNLLNDHE